MWQNWISIRIFSLFKYFYIICSRSLDRLSLRPTRVNYKLFVVPAADVVFAIVGIIL